MDIPSSTPRRPRPETETRRKMLTSALIKQIDDMLASLGEFGEVHLIVQRGELRFVNKVESHKAWLEVRDSSQ